MRGAARTILAVGGLASLAASILVVIATSRFGIRSMFAGDGQHFLHVGMHPTGPIRAGEDAYRWGRILFPALGWVLAGGHRSGVPWALVIINVLAVGLLVGATAWLITVGGGDPRGGLALLLLPIVWGAMRFGFSDLLAVGLAMLGCAAWRIEKTAVAWAAFALAALTRETMLLALVPPILASASRRRTTKTLTWASAAVPLFVWWAVVRSLSGEWPFLAHTVNRSSALAMPFVGLARGFSHGGSLVALGAGLVTIAATPAAGVLLRRDNPALTHALVFGAFVAVVGRGVWLYDGDTLRILLPAHCFLVAGFVTAWSSQPTSRMAWRGPRTPYTHRAGAAPERM